MTVGNGSPETLATYAYNEAGEMIQKRLGTGALQTVDYRYNIRGWMKSINEGSLSGNDLFAMRFRHEESELPQPQYNGNLARYDWISKTDNVLRSYQLGYDGSNRFASAEYSSTAAAEHFSVRTSYQDDNGNIQTLQRQSLVTRNPNAADTYDYVDKLTYAYEGNQLKSVEDDPSLPANAPASDFKEQSRTNVNATEYSYDPSGKLLSDKNKGANVSITYNDLDLPATIQMASNDYLTNVYAATGDKLQMTVTQNAGVVATYQYIGGIVYLNDVPQFIPTPEGRVLSPQVSRTGAWEYEYFYRDHLGDLRVAFRSGGPTRSFTATLDPVDEVAWSNATVPVRNSEQAFNAGGYSAKLVPANPLGPWKTVKVSKGDVVTVSTVGRYVSTTQPNNSAVSLITYVNGLPAQTPESGNNKTWLSLGLQITPQAVNSSQSGVPKAYLEYLLQTEGDNAVTQSKRVYLTAAALNGWESLTMSYTAETDGYLQVLVANDSDQPVWFDNVSIQVQPALITQETHYDLWGLELAGIERRGSPEHRWKFQVVRHSDKESITDLSLYWQDFGARYYDPQLGRWHVGDPADQFASPYSAMGNNPVMLTDPDGRFVPLLVIAAFAVIGGGINVATNWGQIGSLSQGFAYFGIGAISGAVGAATGGLGGAFAAGALMGFGNAGLSGAGLFNMVTSGFTAGVISGITAGVFQAGGQAISNLVARRAAAKALAEAKQLTAGIRELTPKGISPIEGKAASLASREMQEVAVENAAAGTSQALRDPLNAVGVSQAVKDPLNAAGTKIPTGELTKYYPPNNGAYGEVTNTFLMPG